MLRTLFNCIFNRQMFTMKRLSFIFLLFLAINSNAQKIVFSNVISEDNRDIAFEILGKVADHYVIYKNVRWKHMLTAFDANMNLKHNARMTFIPEKTFNIDFIVYPSHFYIIYQYQKNNTIWCKAVKLSSTGQKLSEPITLDTARTGLIADKKIYNTIYSEDKSRILVYKMQRKNDKLTLVTKLYDPELKMLDSTRQVLPFNDRKDIYSDLFVDNAGNFIYAKSNRTGWHENVTGLEFLLREPGKDNYTTIPVSLQERYIDEVKIRIDNLNHQYIVNSLFSTQKAGGIKGLFTVVVNRENPLNVRSAFNIFDDSLRSRINSSGQYSTAFDNLFLRAAYVKRDGGFLLTAEDFYSQATGGNSGFRRYNNLYNSPYTSNYDYYLNSPTYNNFYRPYGNYGYQQNRRYYYDDILVLDIDSSLKLTWNTIIHKKQAEDDHDNFLSFTTVNAGSEIHFLFNDSKKYQIINNHSVVAGGQLKRYPTLKSYESGYDFMPKLAKQVGIKKVIIPCIYRTSIAFALIDFSEN